MESGKLYIVATPMGNMGDVTFRAIETLKSVDHIACEDTRKTGILLKALGIGRKTQLISYYDQTEEMRIPQILNLLINGESVALVSDSGTPLISDPGFRLVRAAREAKLEVVSIPGAVAGIAALTASGLPTDKFTFIGFLPRKEGHKTTLLKKVKTANEELESTVIIYEAPHRLIKTLESIKEVYGNIDITLARELTKIYEEVIGGSIDELLEKYKKANPKGEFVILFNLKD